MGRKTGKTESPDRTAPVPARGGCRRLRAPFPPRGKGRGDRGQLAALAFRLVGAVGLPSAPWAFLSAFAALPQMQKAG